MPLKPGDSSAVKSANIRELRRAKFPRKQAVAIALDKARKYADGGTVREASGTGSRGSTPKSNKLVGEFRDPLERAGGIPWLISYGTNPKNIDRTLGARRRRDPNEELPGNWIGPVTAGLADGGVVDDPLAGMSPIDLLRLRQELAANEQPSAEKGLTTAYDVASTLPVIGNAMAAGDAYTSGRDALAALRRGDWRNAAIEGGVAGVSAAGALSPLPWSGRAGRVAREARDTVNTFVPAEPGRLSDAALAMREEGMSQPSIMRNTGRIVSPDGTLRQEVSDRGMGVKRIFQSGDEATMGALVDHPELFGRYPELADVPVRFVDERVTHANAPGKVFGAAFMDADSKGYGMSSDMPEEFYKDQAAKLLNYRLGEMFGFSPALKHKSTDNLALMDETLAKTQGTPYAARLQPQRDRLAEAVASGDNRAVRRVVNRQNETALGNIDARIARQRAIIPEADYRAWGPDPYAKGTRDVGAGWRNSVILPPRDATPDQVSEFLERFGKYGAGRPQGFARGGRVQRALKRAKVVTGGVRGKTAGRADKLPVNVPAGAYVVPADVVAALGDGNTAAGMHSLDRKFGGKLSRKSGGSVPVLLSDGEYVISPKGVERSGGADSLDRFVLRTRKAFINHLGGLAPPNK